MKKYTTIKKETWYNCYLFNDKHECVHHFLTHKMDKALRYKAIGYEVVKGYRETKTIMESI